MTENDNFEPDCNDFGIKQYDYSQLNSRYEADIERNEIINWNKDADNVTLRSLETIVEELNSKEMQLEHCRKGYEKLMEDNKRLSEHVTIYLEVYRELKKELAEIYDEATLTKAIKLIDEVYDKYANKSPSDTNAELKRKAIIECSDKLREYREELRYL